MFKTFFVVTALVLCAASARIQEPGTAPETAAPPAAAKPIPSQSKPTPESLARAKKMYGYDCAMCHGADGAGKGDLAAQMKLSLSDMSDPAVLKSKTDAQLFALIRDGKGQMPAEGDRVKSDDLWSMVAYVRALPSAPKDKTAPIDTAAH